MPARPYQIEDATLLKEAIRGGEKKLLGTWPTGAGKSHLLAEMPEIVELKPGEQYLAIVDRKELVRQNCERIQAENPDLRVDMERARFEADPKADVIVASIQTLGKAASAEDDGPSQRLKRLDPDRMRCITIDEAHTCAKSYEYARVLKYFGCFKPDPQFDKKDTLLIGVTATPNRSDGIGLEAIFDRQAFARMLKDMNGAKTGLMETGLMVDDSLRTWLCDIESYSISTEVDISDVSVRQGELAVGQLEKAINTPERNKLIVNSYMEYAKPRQFFAFTVDIAHTYALAEEFQKAGLRVYPMEGKTSDGDRKKLFDMFRAGQIDGLVSCAVLSVGVDLPMVECLLMGRPVKSPLLYRQQVGRGLRPWPAPEMLYSAWRKGALAQQRLKPNCMVLDFMDLSGRHVLQAVPTLFGLRGDFDFKGKGVVEALEEIAVQKAKAPGINLSLYKDLETIRGIAERVDLFAVPTAPPELQQYSKLSWTTGIAAGSYQLTLPGKEMLSIRQNALGQYEIYKHVNGVRRPIGTTNDVAQALRMADKEVPRDVLVVLQNDARWREMKPSEPQIGLLKTLYPEMRKAFSSDVEFAQMVMNKYTKGEASTMISQKIGRRRA